MGQSLFTVIDAPILESAPQVLGKLDKLAAEYGELLSEVPLYGFSDDGDDEEWIALFGLRNREEFNSRETSDPRDAVVMDFLASCASRPGLPEQLFFALCDICDGTQMSFQETWDDGYIAYAIEFTKKGVSGTSSSYQLDSGSDEYEMTDHSEFAIAAKKASAKKAPEKKAPAKKAQAPKAAKVMSGKTFMFTGTLATMTRAEAESAVKANGGTILSSVSEKLDYLVAGEKAGSKLAKAKKIPSVTILTEADFSRLK